MMQHWSLRMLNATFSNVTLNETATVSRSSWNEELTTSVGVGIFYVLLSVALLFVYIPTLTVMWTDKKLMSNPVYKLLIWNCLSDLCQVFGVGFVAGIMSLTNSVGNRPNNRFWGSIINIAWLAGGIMEFELALNRLLSVHSLAVAQKWFGDRKVYIWIIVSWLYGLGLNAFYVGRDGGLMYDLDLKAWSYSDYPGSTGNLEYSEHYI